MHKIIPWVVTSGVVITLLVVALFAVEMKHKSPEIKADTPRVTTSPIAPTAQSTTTSAATMAKEESLSPHATNTLNMVGTEFVVSSPKYSDVYTLGKVLPIRWNPKLIDVSVIRLREKAETDHGAIQIYRRDVLEDPVSKNGAFDYMLPTDLMVYPGIYTVELVTYHEQHVNVSDEFAIVSPVPLHKRLEKSYFIQEIIGAKDTYKAGEHMQLIIDARDGDDTAANTQKSFRVSGLVHDNIKNYSVEGSFDAHAGMWNIDIPLTKDAKDVEIDLFCGLARIDSICGQEHQSWRTSSKILNFTIE